MKNGLPLSTFLLYFGEEWRHIGILIGSTLNQKQTAWPSGFAWASVVDCAYERYHFDSHGTSLTKSSWRTPPYFLQMCWVEREPVLRNVTCGTLNLQKSEAQSGHFDASRQAPGSPGPFCHLATKCTPNVELPCATRKTNTR